MGEFGKYEVLSEIGRGGMGIIYKAQDPSLNRFVAIKQLVLDGVDPDKRDEFRERFRREAMLAAGLNHPNLISIYDVSIGEENSYYVMELLEGHSFRQELESRPQQRVSPEELFTLLKQVCDGLAHAHQMNLVHRDVKPDNIFIVPVNKVKVTDFGIARSSEPDNSNLTKPGVMLGTLSYVSPEQLQDARNVDLRADIYSLGVVMYEALAGQLPFTGEGLTSTLMAIVSRDARPVHEVNPDVSNEISSVVAKCMRKQASDRYSSVSEMLKEYEKALNIAKLSSTSSLKLTSSVPLASTASGAPLSAGLPASPPTLRPPSSPSERRVLDTGDLPLGVRQSPVEDNKGTSVPKPWTALRAQKDAGMAEGETSLIRPVTTIGRPGEDRGGLQEPSVICVRGGKVVIGDTGKRKFLIFSRDGRFLGETITKPDAKSTHTAGGAFSKPSSITIDPRGRIFATDSGDQYIRIFDGHGNYVREITNRQTKGGGLTGITCDASGLIYVSDSDAGCVQVIHAETGAWVRKVASKGHGDGQLQLPAGLAVDRSGQLYVVDYGASRISVFSKAGLFQRSFGSKGTGKSEFNVPRGICVDRHDRLYVADSLNHRIQVFNTRGEYLYFFGGRGSETGKFIGPSDLSIDPENNCLYVVDRGNCRVQVFELLQG
jgi:serine/threonine protein kinase/sugar lactone lactonase YvrE